MPTGLYSNIIARIRVLLSDTEDPYRWTDSNLMTWINEARARLWKYRPDAYYLTKIVTEQPADAGLLSHIDVLPSYEVYLVQYTVARALGQDAEHAANMNMSQHYDKLANGNMM